MRLIPLLSIIVFTALPGPAQETPPPSNDPPAVSEQDDPLQRPIPDYREGEQTPAELDSGSLLVRAIASLLIVVGLAILLGFLAKRLIPNRFGGGTGGDHLRIIQTLPLGMKRFVSLIEADGRRLLIGVSEQQITLIKAMDEEPFAETLASMDEPKRVRELEESI